MQNKRAEKKETKMEKHKHGGDIYSAAETEMDFSANINPTGASQAFHGSQFVLRWNGTGALSGCANVSSLTRAMRSEKSR